MRRKEREVTEIKEITAIIEQCMVCRIAMNDENGIYIVPLNFGFGLEEELTLYFHGAKKGRKAEILLGGDVTAGFEMDCEQELVEGEQACNYTYKYASVIGRGKASVIDDLTAKSAALNQIMKQQTGKTFDFPEKMLEATMLFQIKASEYSVKRNG